MNEQGYERTRAMPVTIEIRDSANYTSTATFHVREGTSVEDCKILIEKASALQIGHVDSYTIGYHKTVFAQKPASQHFATGGAKWVIKFATQSDDGSNWYNHRITIPCADNQQMLGRTKQANLGLQQWKDFLEVFLRICVGQEGFPINKASVQVEWKMRNWPPKGQKRRR